MAILPIQGTVGDDNLFGGLSDDFIYGGAGSDNLYGGQGADNLRGGAGADHLFGGEGNDVLNGDEGADTMEGGLGDDTYTVDDAGDLVVEAGGEGYDTVKASVSYTLTANVERLDLQGAANLNGTGNGLDNTLKGNSGDNVLSGLDGKDSISGGDGADTLVGGSGHDWYQGGAGADAFVLDGVSSTETAGAVSTKQLNSASSDTITDFVSGQDHIQVNLSDFAGVNAGVLDAQYFTTGVAANAAHAQFIYDAAHKALLWDADGTGAGKAIKVADINAGATMTAGDILVHTDAPPAPAMVLDFEDLGPDVINYIAGGYHGFDITGPQGAAVIGAHVLSAFGYDNTGYHNLGPSNVVGFNNAGSLPLDIQRTDHSDFIFQGMDVASAWYEGEDITLTGYLDGNVVFSTTVHATPHGPSHIDGNFTVDDLVVTLTVTNNDVGDRDGYGTFVAFDNIGYDLFPHG